MTFKKRAEKLALLAALLNNTATDKQIEDLKKSGEVINLTLNLDDSGQPQEPHFPQYRMEFDKDWQLIRHYDLYEDGRIELRS